MTAKTAHISNGNIYDASGVLVKHPSVLIDGEAGIFICWGEEKDIEVQYTATNSLYHVYGWCNLLGIIDLSSMPVETALYVIKRGTDSMDVDFAREIFNRQNDSDMMEWLGREMSQAPIPA